MQDGCCTSCVGLQATFPVIGSGTDEMTTEKCETEVLAWPGREILASASFFAATPRADG